MAGNSTLNAYLPGIRKVSTVIETGVLKTRSTANIASMKNLNPILIIFGALVVDTSSAGVRLEQLESPPGFSIEIHAENVENARQTSDDMAAVIYRASHT